MLFRSDEIGAAAEEHVLAVIDDLSRAGVQVGGSAAAEVSAALEQCHAKARVSQGARGCKPGHAPTDHGDGVLPAGALVFDGIQAKRGDGSCSLL